MLPDERQLAEEAMPHSGIPVPAHRAPIPFAFTGSKAVAVVAGTTNVTNLRFIKEATGNDVTLSVQLEK